MSEENNADKKRESKLDLWIRQTLLSGGQKPETKIVHQPNPAQAQTSGHTNGQKTPGHPGQHPKAPHKQGHKGGYQHHAGNQARPAQPHSGNQPAKLNLPKSQNEKRGFFFNRNKPKQQTQGGRTNWQGKLRIIPLGGLDEVGKNCMVLEYFPVNKNAKSEIILIDLGFQFPEEDMLGVDYVIPDTAYLQDKLDRIRGIIFTHGHLDHIGAVPYLMPKLNFPPLYGTRLTMGLIEKRLEEFGILKQTPVHNITADDTIKLGVFDISFFRVNHSIPDAVGVVVKTPAGNIVHTGDFKFDFTPSGSQQPADFARISSLSQQDIGALFIDSTNALKPGYTISEKKVGESLGQIIKNNDGRILIASFSSQIGRIQSIIDYAKKYNRTIFLSGRSLIDNIAMAQKLGYLNVPNGLIHDIRKVKSIPQENALILTTGSQGEDVSALTRMASEEHPAVKIKKGDLVVLSSSPIPGNERAVTKVTNNLCRLGARIINNQIMDVHTSGHAQQEDLKLMMMLVKSKCVVPVHGEYYMRYGNKEVAMSIGYQESGTLIVENGDVMDMENNLIRATKEKVECNYVMVDGLGVGDVGAQVIMDRQTLAENGVLIIMVPTDEKTKKLKGEVDVISRGFIFMKQSEELIKAIAELAGESYKKIIEKRQDPKRAEVKKYLRETIDKFVHQKIERHPLIIPIIVEK
ncbi:ribonuclease J [Candidatus Peregrinibacteria bacterium]|nr:ribonuclease J [Candidatus Peregrinibacteria bacterium]